KRRRTEQQRVAVRRRARGGLGADVAAGARPVVDHDLLAQQLREAGRDDAGRGIGAATGREWRDQPNDAVRVSLRSNAVGNRARCCKCRGKLQQPAAGHRFFHGARRNSEISPARIVAYLTNFIAGRCITADRTPLTPLAPLRRFWLILLPPTAG